MVHSRKKNTRKALLVIVLAISLITLIIVGVLFIIPKDKKNQKQAIGIQINNSSYYLEIARTDKQKKIGLSNRDKLCSNCGMIFVFDKEGQYPFWIKYTHIPLDMIWINAQRKIVKIITAVITDSEITYTNQEPAKYVIELPANEVFKQNLKIGETIQIPEIQ